MADTYVVVAQDEQTQYNADGTTTDVVRVTFKTVQSGQSLYVYVPVAGYDAAAVDAAIRPLAAQVDAVQAL